MGKDVLPSCVSGLSFFIGFQPSGNFSFRATFWRCHSLTSFGRVRRSEGWGLGPEAPSFALVGGVLDLHVFEEEEAFAWNADGDRFVLVVELLLLVSLWAGERTRDVEGDLLDTEDDFVGFLSAVEDCLDRPVEEDLLDVNEEREGFGVIEAPSLGSVGENEVLERRFCAEVVVKCWAAGEV